MKIALFLLGVAFASSGGKIDWKRGTDLPAQLLESSKAARPAIVYFTADWSADCVKQDTVTFSDEKIVKLSEAFTRLMVDCTDRAVLEKMAKEYSFRGLPTIVFYDAKGVLSTQFTGFKAPDVIARAMIPLGGGEKTGSAAPPPNDREEWRDTHRFHLVTGTFIDGRLKEEGEKETILLWSKTVVVKLKNIDIEKIERLSIRQIGEDLKTVPVGKDPRSEEDLKLEAKANAVPRIVRNGIDQIIAKMAKLTDADRGPLLKELLDLKDQAEAYVLWLARDKSWEVREVVMFSLGEMKHVEGPRILAEALRKDKEWTVQVSACGALAKFKDESAISALVDALKARNHNVVEAAASALRTITNQTELGSGYNEWIEWFRKRKH